MQNSIIIEKANQSDAAEIAIILRTVVRHNLPYLPELHTLKEDLNYISNIVFPKCQVYIVKDKETIAGFCAFREGWIDYLYILPQYQGNGIGAQLLTLAKAANTEIQLWTFQKNELARKFYESHGFVIVEMTDGEGNEEKEPDIRYLWQL